MSRAASLAPMLSAWIGEAAAAFASLAKAGRARKTVRLSEQEDGLFRLERAREKGRRQGALDPFAFPAGALPPQARAELAGANVEIVLQSRHFLVRTLELPAQAAGFLDGVVRTQIDRITPWKSSEAVFATAPPEPLGPDRIRVSVIATTRSRLSAYLEALQPLGAAAATVSTEIELGGARVGAALLTQSLGDLGRLKTWRRGLTIVLAGAAFACVIAAGAWCWLGLPLDGERDRLEQQISAKRAALLAQRKAAEHDALVELDEKRRASLPTVLTIEALSRVLPNSTHLTELSVEQGKATISGVTDDAAALVGVIEQSRQFAHAAFSAPTTRTPNESGERFHIEAHVEPAWVAAP